jgi:hypothetical protein
VLGRKIEPNFDYRQTKKQTNEQTLAALPRPNGLPHRCRSASARCITCVKRCSLKKFSPQNNRVGDIPRKPRPRPQSNHIYGRMASIMTCPKTTRRVALPRINSLYQVIKATGDLKQYYRATILTFRPADSVQINVDELFSVLGPGGHLPLPAPWLRLWPWSTVYLRTRT